MQSVNLGGLLERATPYEHWRTPIGRRLYQTSVLGGASLLIVLLSGAGLRALTPLELPDACLALLFADLVGGATYLRLLVATDGLRAGRPVWHRVAFGLTILGAINGFVLGLALAGGLLLFTGAAISVIVDLSGGWRAWTRLLAVALGPLAIFAIYKLVKAIAALSRPPERSALPVPYGSDALVANRDDGSIGR